MAKVNLGALAQDVRGSLNGSTFSRNRGGAIVRTKVSPVQPGTARQLAQRAIFSNNTKAWQSLTQANMAAWIAWALINKVTDVFGNQLTLSGINSYLKINATLQTFGLPVIAAPPAPPGPPGANAASVTGVAATNTITITWSSALLGGEQYQIWSTAGFSAGARPTQTAFRLADNITGVAAAMTAIVVPGTLNPKLAFIAGQNVSILVVSLDSQGLIVQSMRFDFVAL